MSANRLLALVVTTFAFAAIAAGAQKIRPVSFPSTETEAVSPDGRFVVVNVDANTEPYHTLFLQDRETQSRRRILDYGRHVDVLWNPKSTSFAITDYAGSDTSQCFLFSINLDQPPVHVSDEIQRNVTNSRESVSMQKNQHLYFQAVRWTSPETLRVRVWGYGDANASGFTRFYTYRLPR